MKTTVSLFREGISPKNNYSRYLPVLAYLTHYTKCSNVICQLDFKINYLSAYYLDSVVCESLEYQAMLEVGSCLQFTTTTPDPVQLHHTDAAAATVTNIFIKVFTTLLAIAKLAH